MKKALALLILLLTACGYDRDYGTGYFIPDANVLSSPDYIILCAEQTSVRPARHCRPDGTTPAHGAYRYTSHGRSLTTVYKNGYVQEIITELPGDSGLISRFFIATTPPLNRGMLLYSPGGGTLMCTYGIHHIICEGHEFHRIATRGTTCPPTGQQALKIPGCRISSIYCQYHTPNSHLAFECLEADIPFGASCPATLAGITQTPGCLPVSATCHHSLPGHPHNHFSIDCDVNTIPSNFSCPANLADTLTTPGCAPRSLTCVYNAPSGEEINVSCFAGHAWELSLTSCPATLDEALAIPGCFVTQRGAAP